jgi:hypothetical protein
MSYIVHLWQRPVPTSLAHAESTLRELRQQLRFGDDGSVRSLLTAIEAGLPANSCAADFWTEVPEAETSDMVLTLSPSLAELEVVLQAIEAAARKLGWVVLDPQSGEVSLPSGKVLSHGEPRVERPLATRPADLDTSPAVRKAWLTKSLTPMFTRRGWQCRQGEICFHKTFRFGDAQIYLDAKRQTTMRHGMWLLLHLPPRLQPALDSDGGPSLVLSLEFLAQRQGSTFAHDGQPDAIIGGEVGSPTYGLPCASADDVARRLDELLNLYDNVVLDWLESLSSLAELEHYANRVPDNECPFIGLRRRGGYRLPTNYHPDLLLAAAVEAPDLEHRARERLALYEADGFGRGLVPALRDMLKVCGLEL